MRPQNLKTRIFRSRRRRFTLQRVVRKRGQAFVSPFVGRLDDRAKTGWTL